MDYYSYVLTDPYPIIIINDANFPFDIHIAFERVEFNMWDEFVEYIKVEIPIAIPLTNLLRVWESNRNILINNSVQLNQFFWMNIVLYFLHNLQSSYSENEIFYIFALIIH